MQAFVFLDERLSSYARQVVWLAIDTEKAANAAVIEKYPVPAWPSLFLIDPEKESILLRWTGSASVEQLARFLDQGKRAMAGGLTGTAAQLALADKLYADEKYAEAAPAYAAAIATAPKEWGDLPRASDAMLFSLQMAEQPQTCTQAAHNLLPRLKGTPSYGNAAASGLDCAIGLEKTVPSRAALIAHFEKVCREVLQQPNLATDDRSGLYQELISARDDAGDTTGKKALEADWVAMLELAAKNAPTPAARAAFDSHRLGAYLEIGEPQRAIPMLEQSEQDLPDEYNPPARLSVAYNAMKEYDKALAASDRALAKSYGPRRLVIFRTRSDIYKGKGDVAMAKKVLEQAIAEAKALPKAQRSDNVIAGLEKKLARLSS